MMPPKVSREILRSLFPERGLARLSYWWEPDAFPYDSELYKEADGMTNSGNAFIQGQREENNKKYFNKIKCRENAKLAPYGYSEAIDEFEKNLSQRVDRNFYSVYKPRSFIYPPVDWRDEYAYVSGIDFPYHQYYDLMVEDTTMVSDFQPSFRPVLLVRYLLLKDTLGHLGHHLEDQGHHSRQLRWELEQGFESLFDILIIDLKKHTALHWQRQEDGRFSKKANEVNEGEVAHLLGLDIDLHMTRDMLGG